MAIEMQQLTNMVSKFARMGDNHVKLSGNNVVKATNSLMGRVVNWCKAGSRANADANRATINKVLDDIKNGLGDRFAEKAKSEFAKNLKSGRPISAMKVSQVLGNAVKVAKIEIELKHANYKINAESQLAHLKESFAKGEGALFDAVVAGAKHWQLPNALENESFIEKIEASLVDKFTKASIANDSTVSQEQVRDICLASAKHEAMKATLDHAKSMLHIANDISQPAADLPSRMSELQSRILMTDIDIPLESLAKIAKNIEDKLEDKIFATHKQASNEMIREVRDACIKKFLGGLRAVEDAPNLDANQKATMIKMLVNSGDIYNEAMATACVKNFEATNNFFACVGQKGTSLEDMQAAINTMQETFTDSIVIVKDGQKQFNPDIGADQQMAIRDILVRTVLDINGMISPQKTEYADEKLHALRSSLEGDKDFSPEKLERHPELRLNEAQRAECIAELEVEVASMKKLDMFLDEALRHGGALNTIRYGLSQSDEGSQISLGRHIDSLLLLANLNTSSPYKQDVINTKISTLELGMLTFTEARAYMPEGHGKFGDIDKPKALLSLTKGAVESFEKSKPQYLTMSADELSNMDVSFFTIKEQFFSESFLKDFWRGGIEIDGERIYSSGTNDPKAMEEALDKLLAHFPDARTAGLVTSGLHQGLAADMFMTLTADPASSKQINDLLFHTGIDMNDGLNCKIQDNDDGTYSVSASVCKQRVGDKDSIGMNLQADYLLSVDLANSHVQANTVDFDYIMN